MAITKRRFYEVRAWLPRRGRDPKLGIGKTPESYSGVSELAGSIWFGSDLAARTSGLDCKQSPGSAHAG